MQKGKVNEVDSDLIQFLLPGSGDNSSCCFMMHSVVWVQIRILGEVVSDAAPPTWTSGSALRTVSPLLVLKSTKSAVPLSCSTQVRLKDEGFVVSL